MAGGLKAAPRMHIVPPSAPLAPPRSGGAPKTQVLAALRRRIEGIERPRRSPSAWRRSTRRSPKVVCARRLADGAAGPVLWCLERALPYPPGLAAFGLGRSG